MADHELIERLPRQLRMRELRVFVAVLEQGSFRKAAASLHITQPAVTKAIAALESVLGVRLFDRGTSGVEPTVHGNTFAPHARAVFGELRNAALRLGVVSRGVSGTLQVGTAAMPTNAIVPAAIGRLLSRNRRAFVTMIEARETELADLLRKGAIDIAFVRVAALPLTDDLRLETLYEQSLHVVASRNHPLASRMQLTWAEVENEPWVLPPSDSPFRQQVRRALERADLAMPRSCVEAASIHLQYGMVLHGSMLSFGLRKEGPAPSTKDLLVRLPVALPRFVDAVGAVTLHARDQPPLAARLIDEVRELSSSIA